MNTGEWMRSAAHCTMFIGCSTIITSIGASAAVITSLLDDPMCMQTIVPSSEHACQNGSQWSECRLGRPSGSGFSGNVTAWQPFFATRRISAAQRLGVPDHRDRERDEALGRVPAPLVDVPVVVRLREHDRRRPCPRAPRRDDRRSPGRLGKFSEPSTPFAFMSRTRFSTSKQPSRISSKDVGSIPYSSLGRPATALSPMFGTSKPWNDQTSVPSSLWMSVRGDVLVLRRAGGARTCPAARRRGRRRSR